MIAKSPNSPGVPWSARSVVHPTPLYRIEGEPDRHGDGIYDRMHAVGASRDAPSRPRLDVKRYVHEPLEVLLGGRFIPDGLAPRYRDVAVRIAEHIAKPLAAARVQRIHGDLHWGNILWTPEPLLVDFDDCMVGPPVQDLWLLARGPSDEARQMREDLLEGYGLFREFDRGTLALCEPLRALRIVYMSGWIARRWDDPSFPNAFPLFRNHNYWTQEYEELLQIAEGLA